MFYPPLSRAQDYRRKKCGNFYIYSEYKDEILSDCKERCVYCDITLKEHGHEGFSLDHFRPQEHFPHLKNTPFNLVITCSKCNRLKSSHWPMPVVRIDSHDGNIGFLDPFSCDRLEYFNVDETGEISAIKNPSTYIIQLLNLNRPSRKLVRKKRLLDKKISSLLEMANAILNEITPRIMTNSCSEHDLIKYVHAKSALDELVSLKE